MADRYSEDIRRIVGIEDVGNPLGPASERDAVYSKRSIAYYDASGSINNSSDTAESGTGGANIPNGDGTNPSTGTPGGSPTSSGSSPIKDPYDPLSWLSEPGDTDVANADTFPPYNSLQTLTGVDPNTGKDVDVYFGDYSHDVVESNWPPPIEVTPVDPTFQPGFYWEHLAALVAGQKFQTPTEAHDAFVAAHTAQQAGFDNVFEYDPVQSVAIDTYQSCFRQIVSNGNPIPPGPTACIDIARFGCTIADPDGPGDYCSLIPPGGSEELLDKIQVRINSEGKIETNPDQNPDDTDGFLGEGFDSITLESKENPGEFYTIEPGIRGGTLVYQSSSETPGEPSTDIYTYIDSSGVTSFGDITTIDYVKRP